MMSLELAIETKIVEDFLAVKKLFEEIGFEIVGTKDIYDHKIYLVKKKEK